jgi:hypothetical protein
MTARASAAYSLCACLLGCAAPGSTLTAVSPHKARDAITIGKSTRSDVIAAFGKTAAVAFESGYEVWVYGVSGDASGKAEFVVLFAPSGVVTKTRTRPAP